MVIERKRCRVMPAELLDITGEDLHKIDAVSWSSLRWMAESPLSYIDHKKQPFKDTPDMQFGRVAHSVLLENKQAIGCSEEKVNRGTKAFEKFVAAFSGKGLPVTMTELEMLAMWQDGYRENEYYELFQDNPQIEKAIVWTDPDTGIKCKGKLDLFTDSILLDLKTTRDTSEHAYWNNFAYSNTEGQFAFYYDALYELDGGLRKCIVGRLEKQRPYDTVWSALRTEVVWGGRRLYKKLLRDLAECLDKDKWPGKSNNTIKEDGFPNWKLERNLAL